MKNLFLPFIVFCLICISCSKDEIKNTGSEKEVLSSVDIQEFVYSTMKEVYLWNDKIPNLTLGNFKKVENLFESICYRNVDKWSFITDDYTKTLNMFKGITTSFGHVLTLGKFSNSSNVFAIVLYVYRNSPASDAGLKRGDIIIKVDGETPTIDNYQELFGRIGYTLTMGEFIDGGIRETIEEKVLFQREIDEHPIIHKQIFGGTKTAYLMYSSFINRFNEDLKEVFAEFKTQGVEELILDLRYNGGGDDISATMLASLIAPQLAVSKGKYFFKSVYNNNFTEYFKNNIDKARERNALGMKFKNYDESLNLKRVFILTTKGTASASELVINGLKPVMDVCVIGDTTHGKCTGMTGIADDDKNPQWGIFPVIVKAANSNGVTDYFNGLFPDILVDDTFPFAPLGSIKDPLIKAALAEINSEPMNTLPIIKTERLNMEVIGTVGDKPRVCKNLILN